MARPTSLARRALLAIGLMVGFYVLALVISAALVAVPVLEYRLRGRITFQLAFACLGSAGAVLWALVPRRDQFTPPGPLLERARYPRLFAMLDAVAAATGQAAPAEVYALNQINAFVTQRGGVMGVGSRRVMGIGLPLVQHLSTAELTAVIGHEFGHYDSGDVALGPWIYKTRAAIGRTIDGVQERQWLARPFEWYGHLFLRLTYAISRQQEFVADAIGARVGGRAAMASALERVAVLAPAYDTYLQQYIGPAVNVGRLPPLLDGFTRFLHADANRAWLAEVAALESTFGERSAYDTHPPLQDRIGALDAGPAGGAGASVDPPAATLVPDADALVQQMIATAVQAHGGDTLTSLAWDELGMVVILPAWRQTLTHLQGWFADHRRGPAEQPRGPARLATPMARAQFATAADETTTELLTGFLTAALGVTLADRGWRLHASPGEPTVLRLGDQTEVPLQWATDLVSGVCTPDAWRATCDRRGLTGAPLVPAS
ncbi:MAG: M48 family metallopeptidase [Vicinamibacterales bacterium]